MFAVTCVAIATTVRIILGLISPDSAVFAPYYAAILVAALVGGAMAGGVAALLGGLAAYWLFEPREWSVAPFVVEQLVSFILFSTSSLVIIWAAESYRVLLQRVREEEARRQIFNHELAHRIRNTMASVQAIVSQTLRGQRDLLDKVSARIQALGVTHDLLIRSEWNGASLREILVREFVPYDPSRFQMIGEDVRCPSAIAVSLALVFHELATNAMKYGAISTPEGRVIISWKIIDDRLDFEWRELGGPEPCSLAHEGFGMRLLRTSLKQFDGSVDMRFEPTGVRLKMSLMLPRDPQPSKRYIASDEAKDLDKLSPLPPAMQIR